MAVITDVRAYPRRARTVLEPGSTDTGVDGSARARR
jgi:hypothetical protein